MRSTISTFLMISLSGAGTSIQNSVHLLTMPPIRVPRLEELVSRESPIKTPIPE